MTIKRQPIDRRDFAAWKAKKAERVRRKVERVKRIGKLAFSIASKRLEDARREREEKRAKASARSACVVRDGRCRVYKIMRSDHINRRWAEFPCEGKSEWAHLGEKRRFKTTGMEPEERHTTAGSMMACTKHHRMYDGHRLEVLPLAEHGADGLMSVMVAGEVFREGRR